MAEQFVYSHMALNKNQLKPLSLTLKWTENKILVYIPTIFDIQYCYKNIFFVIIKYKILSKSDYWTVK